MKVMNQNCSKSDRLSGLGGGIRALPWWLWRPIHSRNRSEVVPECDRIDRQGRGSRVRPKLASD